MTVAQAQKLLGCCNASIYKIIHQEDFPTLHKTNLKSYVFNEKEFREWAEKHNYKLKEN